MSLSKIENTIKKYNLIDKNDLVLMGVSGGADSVALVLLLNSLKKDLKISLHIAHLDHMLRKDSRKDAEFVRKLAGRLKIPVTSGQINVMALAKKGSLEEVARNARLGFLFGVAKEIKADKIALGHNLDDQAETVLMRILRGAGLCGLSGIMPKKDIAGFTVIRPLIETRRKDIEAFLKKKKIKPRIDVTNSNDIYFRNKIRRRLLPLLERGYNRNIKEVLGNMASSLAQDYDYLKRQANFALARTGKRLYLNKLIKLHPSIQRLMLRLSIAGLKGDTRSITFGHIREIEDLILNRPINSIVDLPKGISVIKRKGLVSFYRRTPINT